MHPNALLDSCSELLKQVLKFDHPADMVVSRHFREQRLGPRERATVAETIYTVLRKKSLFTNLAQSGSGALERRLAILGFAAERDFLLGALTEQEKDWLQRCGQVQPEDLMELHRHNLPQWLVDSLRLQLGDGFWPLVESLNAPAGLDLRVNTLKDTRESVLASLREEDLKAEPTALSPLGIRLPARISLGDHAGFRDGLFEVQDEASQICAHLVNAQPGMVVMDLCGGAGGKTLAVAGFMQNKGRLIACDVSVGRLERSKLRLRRAGVHNATLRVLEDNDKWIKRQAGSFDRVLVDAPCSGTGAWRRNPDARWHVKPENLESLALVQAQVLEQGSGLVKLGGRLIYATCSLLTEENAGRVETFLATHPQFKALPIQDVWKDVLTAPCPTSDPFLTLSPHRNATDGFFVAVLERVS